MKQSKYIQCIKYVTISIHLEAGGSRDILVGYKTPKQINVRVTECCKIVRYGHRSVLEQVRKQVVSRFVCAGLSSLIYLRITFPQEYSQKL